MPFDQLKRRDHPSVGAAAPWPLAARAQQLTLPVIGFLNGGAAWESAKIVARISLGPLLPLAAAGTHLAEFGREIVFGSANRAQCVRRPPQEIAFEAM
jgi:hypothetical protein